MKFKSLGIGSLALCTFVFVFFYVYTTPAVNVWSMDMSFSSWRIGQGTPWGNTFITNSETSCNIQARVRYDPDTFPLPIVDGPNWKVTMTHGFTFDSASDTEEYQKTGNGDAHVPSGHPNNGRGNTPMQVRLTATLTCGSHPDSEGAITKTITKTIKQDTIDQIRQEYVDHGINVPSRSDFTSNSNYNTGDYGYAIDQNLAGRKSAWATACGVTQTDMRLSSGYRNPEHNRHHIGTPGNRGARRSAHQYGRALDIYTIDVNNDGNINVTDSDLMITAARQAGARYWKDYPTR